MKVLGIMTVIFSIAFIAPLKLYSEKFTNMEISVSSEIAANPGIGVNDIFPTDIVASPTLGHNYSFSFTLPFSMTYFISC